MSIQKLTIKLIASPIPKGAAKSNLACDKTAPDTLGKGEYLNSK